MVMFAFALSFGVPVVWVGLLNLSLIEIDIHQVNYSTIIIRIYFAFTLLFKADVKVVIFDEKKTHIKENKSNFSVNFYILYNIVDVLQLLVASSNSLYHFYFHCLS